MKLLLFREKTFCNMQLTTLRGKEKKIQAGEKKKTFQDILDMKTPALGLLSVVEWLATLSRSSQLSIKLSEQRRSPTPKPPWLCAPSSERLQGPAALKTLASPSLPEGHEASSARQNPCEFTLYSKWHVPAAQCDTIRGWLCVNQMMTACWLGCPACCHSPPANPLPRESGNWFPDFQPPPTPTSPPWECCFPHLVRHSNRADPRVGNLLTSTLSVCSFLCKLWPTALQMSRFNLLLLWV